MQVTYRIPSKKVPYGYIEFTWKREAGTGMPDPVEMAVEYADYIKAYQTAEVAAFEKRATLQAHDKPDKAVDEAAKMLSDGLGATEIDESEPVKPWDKSADESTTESKPWETNAGDWDFS